MADPVRWVRFGLKPVLWVLCLAPLSLLTLRLAGVDGLGFGPNPVEQILRTLGKTGLNLLLFTLAVTPVRQLTGWNALVRVRRLLGLFAFFYLLAHFLFYLVVDRGLDWRTVVEDVAKRPYITIGFAALLMLVPLALTSTQRAMRALGRRWQRLHRAVYAVALLGCIHYYWQVKADVREPFVYFGILFVLLGFRWWKRRAHARQTATQRAVRSPLAATAMAASTNAPPRSVRVVTASPNANHPSSEAITGSASSVTATNAGGRWRSE